MMARYTCQGVRATWVATTLRHLGVISCCGTGAGAVMAPVAVSMERSFSRQHIFELVSVATEYVCFGLPDQCAIVL